MAYEKQNFTDGQVLKAAHLNHIESGIAELEASLIDVVTDEDLMAGSYTLTAADFIHGIWSGELDAGSDTPYTTIDTDSGIGDKFCTRKLTTTKVPRMSYFYFTTPSEYVFWRNGTYVGKLTYAEVSAKWMVDFVFDEVAINFSWGYDYVSTEVVVTLTVADGKFEKVLVLGDSISTDYYGNYTKWVTSLIDESFLPVNTTNDSIHATGFVARYTAEDASATNDFINRIAAVTDKDTYDLVVIFGGINDYIQAVPMGESGGDITVSFKPAVDYFFQYLVENFTQARIVVLSPLRTYNVYANTAGHYQTEYADYIKEVAKSYCLPVLNLTEESGFYPFNETFKAKWTLIPDGYEEADGVHPNEEYQRDFLAPMIKNFLAQFA